MSLFVKVLCSFATVYLHKRDSSKFPEQMEQHNLEFYKPDLQLPRGAEMTMDSKRDRE
jgi:hypothetical protein